MSGDVPWPSPPRDPGAWAGGAPVGSRGGHRGGAPSPVGITATGPSPFPAAPPTAPPGWAGSPGSGEPQGGMIDRAPAAVILVAVLVLAAVAAGAGYLVYSERDRYPDEWDERAQPVVTWVADARGLEFKHPVEVNFLSDAEYSALAQTDPAESDEEEEAIADAAAELRALGLLSGNFDLVESMNTLNDSGTLAFYSPATEQVYVRGETLTPGLRVTLAHELVHVLQDQHFDLSRATDMTSTRAGVLRALAEGDAGRIEEVYVEEVLTDAEREEYEAESAGEGDEALETIREDVPDAITALFAAPYVFGEPLVSYLYDTGGQAEIDEALAEPPSEEVLFDPHLWKAPEAEPVAVDVVMPNGATEIERDDFGPIAWYLVLASRMDPQTALAAVDGLGGDQYVTFRDGSKVCVRATVVGDDDTETLELESALELWVQSGVEGSGSVSRDDDENLRFQACDPGEDAEATGSISLEVLALPVTRTTIYQETIGAGATEDQAWCYASRVMELITYDDLVNPGPGLEAKVAGAATGFVQECLAAG